jgi:hypothetical protein
MHLEEFRLQSFPRGSEFPNEGFVQQAIEGYFQGKGYTLLAEGYTDLACVDHKTGDRWVVEAKGHSASVGVDFNTCLGQLLKRMDDAEVAHFGLAVPKTAQYERQIGTLSRRVRKALDLHWLLVDQEGVVEIRGPAD